MHASPTPTEFDASYRRLLRSGELEQRVGAARRHLHHCDLCARYCGTNRLQTAKGAVCRTGRTAVVHSHMPHHGEEGPLRGTRGSGTIFFSWCNLRCAYCQNWEINHRGDGRPASADQLAHMMLALQEAGCHNINLVSPSHVVAQIIEAVFLAAQRGLRLPLVYNTGGYDSLEALGLLEGLVDIYMPDLKYSDPETARRYSRARGYPAFNHAAVREMHRQVGDLVVDRAGIARRGLLVRHLVLPGGLSGSAEIFRFIAEEISPHTYVNIMGQYYPCYKATHQPPLDRPLGNAEYDEALRLAVEAGLTRLDHRRDRDERFHTLASG